ncbi:MAG: acyl carrier protein [Actinomycetota bacterium]|jgi:acyl carrier protein
MSKEMEQEITQFIVEEVLDEEAGSSLNPDQPLLTGLLDSFGLMSLLAFIEEHYEVTIPNNEVVTENFRTVEVLAGFVEAKQKAGQQATSA